MDRMARMAHMDQWPVNSKLAAGAAGRLGDCAAERLERWSEVLVARNERILKEVNGLERGRWDLRRRLLSACRGRRVPRVCAIRCTPPNHSQRSHRS